LVLSQQSIEQLGLQHSGTISAELGDGSSVVLDTYTCRIEWFGQDQVIEAIASQSPLPLLGIGVLRGHRLTIDYDAASVAVD